MKEHTFDIRRSFFFQIVILFFLVLSVWWFTIYNRGLVDAAENNQFTLIYPLLSLIGGIGGLFFAKKWGGFKSLLGKVISLLSFGLLAQFFGQAIYAYYIYVMGVEVPYPSIGDVGYFGSVLLYIGAVYFLAKASGLKFSFRSIGGKVVAFLIPIAMLVISYLFFLNGYEFDWTNKLRVFLDFGYPLGQAVYVSMAISALFMSQRFLGGLMKKPIIFLIFALIFQYFSDFMFLYQANRGTWYVGGLNDYLYFVSYFLMTVGLVYFNNVLNKIQNS